MVKLALGIVIGALIYYYWPDQVEDAIQKVETVIHESASKAAEATKPKSEFEKLIDNVTDPLKGN